MPTPVGSTASAPRVASWRSRHAGVALVAAAITAYEEQEAAERQYFLATAHGGRPQARHEVGRAVDLKLGGVSHRVAVAQVGADRFRVRLGSAGAEHVLDVRVEQLDDFTSRLHVGEPGVPARRCRPRCRCIWSRSTASRTGSAGTRAASCAHPRRPWWSPRRSRSARRWQAGAPVLVLESMKMETVITAPFAARVRELMVATGGQVETGMPMVRLEPLTDEESGTAADVGAAGAVPELDLPASPQATGAAARAAALLADLRGMLLGFDVAPDRPDRDPGGVPTAARRRPGRRPHPVAHRARRRDGVRRPGRADPQPARRRGDQRRAGAQPAGVLPLLPAQPRRRPRTPARRVPDRDWPGSSRTTACRTSTAARRSRRRSIGSSSPSSARPRTSRSSPPCSSTGSLTSRRSTTWASRPTTCSTGWWWRPSCASRSWVSWRAARGSAGSTSRSPRQSGPTRWPGCPPSSTT